MWDMDSAADYTLHMQSLEAMQGVVQQEMKGLQAERGAFKDLVHDARWAASQAAGSDQASVSTISTAGLPRLHMYLVHESH